MHTKKLAMGGLLLALGVLVPQVIHATGIPQIGNILLPMHIPVLLAGFCLGPVYGGLVGLICPFISAFFGMPPMDRAPFMMGELAVYGAVSGALCAYTPLMRKKGGTYAVLLTAMVSGRVMYALMLAGAAWLLHIPCGGPMAAVTATVTGLPGIVIQLVLVPLLLLALRKGGVLRGISADNP